jgi:hypothetical protein
MAARPFCVGIDTEPLFSVRIAPLSRRSNNIDEARTPVSSTATQPSSNELIARGRFQAGAFIIGRAHLYELNRVFEKLMNRSSEIKIAIVP